MRLAIAYAITVHVGLASVSAFSLFLRNRDIQRAVLLPLSGVEDDNDRNEFGNDLRGLQSAGMKNTIETGDTVICKRDIPQAGIYADGSYKLQSIYAQRFTDNQVEKVTLPDLDAVVPLGYDRYITLYSSKYHEEPVVVTPEEVGLVSLRSQFIDAAWLAVPGLFWVFVGYSFYGVFHERTGGSFVDALLGRY